MKKIIETAKKIYAGLTDDGLEIPDPTPMALPIGHHPNESMDARIARIVSHSLSVQAEKEGFETFSDADDFDIEDDPVDPSTPWETDFDLATAHAAERGVVQSPSQEETARAHATLNTYMENDVKRKKGKKTEKKLPPAEDDTPLPLED